MAPATGEYITGTDPNDPLSYLKIDSITAANLAMLTFHAVSNKTYTIEFSDDLRGGSWSRLADVLARSTNRVETVVDTSPQSNRVYRLVAPRQPGT